MSNPADKFDAQTRLELEAAAFRRLLAHLDERKDVQNIDLMNLQDFAATACRNGIWPRPKPKILNSITARRARSSMEWLTRTGRRNISLRLATIRKKRSTPKWQNKITKIRLRLLMGSDAATIVRAPCLITTRIFMTEVGGIA